MCLEVRKDDGNLLHLLFVMQKAGNIDGKPSYSYYLCKIHYIGLMGSPNVLLLFMSGSSLIRSLPGQAHPSMRMQYAYLFFKVFAKESNQDESQNLRVSPFIKDIGLTPAICQHDHPNYLTEAGSCSSPIILESVCS